MKKLPGFSYDSAGQVITESNNVAGSSGRAPLSYARGMPPLLTYPNEFGVLPQRFDEPN